MIVRSLEIKEGLWDLLIFRVIRQQRQDKPNLSNVVDVNENDLRLH